MSRDLHEKELRKTERKEKAKLKSLQELKYDLDIETALLNKRLHKSKSQNVKQKCKTRLAEIEKTLREYENELKQIQDQKRHIARSMVSIV